MNVMALEVRPVGIQPIPAGNAMWVTIRPIESSDWEGLFDFYRGLSAQARYTRFLGMSPGIDDRAAHHFATARQRGADGFVAILREAGPGDGRVVGHLCMEPMPSRAEEIAVAVAGDMRRLGVGTNLMAAAMRAARDRRVPKLTASMFAGNEPMRRLFLGAGGRLMRQWMDAGVASMELDPEGLETHGGKAQ
jgi:RimJ/RimL family protein N-acetyltransferase